VGSHEARRPGRLSPRRRRAGAEPSPKSIAHRRATIRSLPSTALTAVVLHRAKLALASDERRPVSPSVGWGREDALPPGRLLVIGMAELSGGAARPPNENPETSVEGNVRR